jgi:hypothetical protein
MGIKCFFVEPTERAKRSLRRYSANPDLKCSGSYRYHNAHAALDEAQRPFDKEKDCWHELPDPKIPHDDPRWPVKCDACDYRFTADDNWQLFDEQIYIDKATGREYSIRDRIPGMMWDAIWMHEWARGPDGRSLVVVCPDGHKWMIDGHASNCTMPNDEAHRCWTRTGSPPALQVGKQFGKSCSAGGGSIQTPGYHGFLGTQGAAPGEFT